MPFLPYVFSELPMNKIFLAIFSVLFGCGGGQAMKPDKFFVGAQLAAYRLAQQGNTDQLTQIAKTGLVNWNQPGKEDMTMLGLAVINADKVAIKNLMRVGADPNQVIPDVGTPAILAITKHFNPPRTEAVAALIEGGYDPNQLIDAGKPFVFFFADYNHWSGLKYALEHGGNINVQRNTGKSLLTYVIEGGDYSQARNLIAMGADVAARGQRNETALRAIEFTIRRANPIVRKVWSELLSMRQLILSKLTNPQDRRSAFSDEVEKKISENP
jgi:ankyrin repeat protein